MGSGETDLLVASIEDGVEALAREQNISQGHGEAGCQINAQESISVDEVKTGTAV